MEQTRSRPGWRSAGVRADVGGVTVGGRTVTWAAIANWEPATGTTLEPLTVWAVLRGMRHIGEQVLTAVRRG